MKYLSKIIEYGLYSLVFLLSLQTRWVIRAGELNGGPWEYGTYSLYVTDILLILLLLLFIVRVGYSRIAGQVYNEKIYGNKIIWWFIGGLLLMCSISFLLAASKWLALYKLGWLILGVGLFWLITSANYSRLKMIYFMLTGLFFQAVLGIWQFLTQSSFANKWLGMALHNGADLGTSVVEAVGSDGILERWLRAYGGFDHPNMLGGALVIGILLILYLSFADAPVKNFFGSSGALLLKGFLIIFFAGLFFSFSRSAWLALAVGLAITAVLAIIGRNLKSQKGLAEIILVMGILLFILFSQYQNLITSRLDGEGRLEEKSASERLVSYQESWQLIKNNWATGVGLGNYTYVLNRQTPNQESFYYQPAHNVFLLVWSETGIVGLLFFAGLILYL
ncbi:MAG: O-antigen ligase family protein, partial [bacterium]